MQQTTYSPVYEYKKIHHVPQVTQAFIDFLKGSIEMQIHVTQHVENPPDKLGTTNDIVVQSIKTNEPMGYQSSGAARPPSDAEIRCQALTVQLQQAQTDNGQLLERIAELEKTIVLMGAEVPRSNLAERLRDATARSRPLGL